MGFANCPKNLPLKERFERFFTKGTADQCWVWQGCRDAKGYGRIQIKTSFGKGANERTHRTSYKLYKGPIPEGQHVLHSCDNAGCVNPSHLSVGTNNRNQIEAWARDRKTNVRKLSADDVMFIRTSSMRQFEMAKVFGVHQSEISRIRAGKRGVGIMRVVQAEGGVSFR